MNEGLSRNAFSLVVGAGFEPTTFGFQDQHHVTTRPRWYALSTYQLPEWVTLATYKIAFKLKET